MLLHAAILCTWSVAVLSPEAVFLNFTTWMPFTPITLCCVACHFHVLQLPLIWFLSRRFIFMPHFLFQRKCLPQVFQWIFLTDQSNSLLRCGYFCPLKATYLEFVTLFHFF